MRLFKTCLIVIIALILGACVSASDKKSADKKKDKLVTTNVKLGIEYMQRDQLEYAKEKFDKALQVDQNSAQANNAMALLMWRFKNMDKAEYHFEKAVSNDPGNADAQNNYGVFLCQRGEISAAVSRFDKALLNPLYATPAQANLNAGLCLVKAARHKQASEYFQKALAHDPKLPKALYHMANFRYLEGNLLSARGFMERFFAVSKDTAESLLLALKIERGLGDDNAAANYRIRLRGKFPDSPEAKSIGKRRR